MVAALTSLMLKQPWHTIKEASTSADSQKHSSLTFLVHLKPAWISPCHSLHKGPVVHTVVQLRCPTRVRTPQDTFLPDEQGLVHGRVHLLDPNVHLHTSNLLRETSEKGL